MNARAVRGSTMHRRELHVHCYRMVGSVDDADDVLQDAFLRAWRHRRTFDGSTQVGVAVAHRPGRGGGRPRAVLHGAELAELTSFPPPVFAWFDLPAVLGPPPRTGP